MDSWNRQTQKNVSPALQNGVLLGSFTLKFKPSPRGFEVLDLPFARIAFLQRETLAEEKDL